MTARQFCEVMTWVGVIAVILWLLYELATRGM